MNLIDKIGENINQKVEIIKQDYFNYTNYYQQVLACEKAGTNPLDFLESYAYKSLEKKMGRPPSGFYLSTGKFVGLAKFCLTNIYGTFKIFNFFRKGVVEALKKRKRIKKKN